MRYLIVLVFVGFVAGQSKPGAKLAPQTSATFYAAARLAYDSLKSLGPQEEASEIAFQPRQIEAEKNLAAAERKTKTTEESRQLAVLKAWARMIDLYRWQIQNHGLSQRALDIFHVQDTCFSEAVFIFERASLGEQEKGSIICATRWRRSLLIRRRTPRRCKVCSATRTYRPRSGCMLKA